MKIETDITYREVEGYDPSLNTLDIYCPDLRASTARRRSVIFIHGGNWTTGDKSSVAGPGKDTLPTWFTDKGYVFISVNFRLPQSDRSPDATVPDMVDDISKAIKWLTINIRRYGGLPKEFILVGYSSGAHLATLTATCKSYLLNYRLPTSIISTVIGFDVPFYDISEAIREMKSKQQFLPNQDRRLSQAQKLLGSTKAAMTRMSPVSHLGPWVRDTRFLLLSAGLHQGVAQDFSRKLSEKFKNTLREHDIEAHHVHFEGADHNHFALRFGGNISSCVEDFLNQTKGFDHLYPG